MLHRYVESGYTVAIYGVKLMECHCRVRWRSGSLAWTPDEVLNVCRLGHVLLKEGGKRVFNYCTTILIQAIQATQGTRI